MSSKTTYITIGVVCLLLGAGGFWLYQEQHRSGVDITIGGRGVSIQQR